MPLNTHGTAVVLSLIHSERTRAITTASRVLERGRLARAAAGVGSVEPLGQGEEDLLEAAALVDELVQDDLVLCGQWPEPLRSGPVDDDGVGPHRTVGHRDGVEYGHQAPELGAPDPQAGAGAGPTGQFGQRRLHDQLARKTTTMLLMVSSISESRWDEPAWRGPPTPGGG